MGDFIRRMKLIPEVNDYLERLVYWIKRIGEKGIDEQKDFRFEGICKALPPDIRFSHEENELRLYCHILTNNIVILFNGDRKTHGAKSSQECTVVEPHRLRAERWTNKIQKEKIETKGVFILNINDILITY